jgi:hypothetical protein
MTLVDYRIGFQGATFGSANGLNSWDSNNPSVQATGTATSGSGSQILVDSSKSWTVNQFVPGFVVRDITQGGTNEGTFALITSNNATKLFCAQSSKDGDYLTPSSGDSYAIYQVFATLDMPGVGSGNLISNTVPTNTVTSLQTWPFEGFEPIYAWSNLNNGTLATIAAPGYNLIQNGINYSNAPKPGYTPLVYPDPLDTTNASGSSPGYTLTVVNGTGSGTYNSNSIVSISANTIANEIFTNWSGVDVANPNLASTTVTMPASNLTVQANFASNPAPSYTLTVVNGTGSGSYTSNSVVGISANTISGEYFTNWSGLQIANTNSANTTVTMPGGNLTVTANFATNLAPTVPTGLTAVAVSTNQINLNWQASTDHVGVTGYVVQRSQGTGSTSFTQIATPTGTNYSDTGLTAATTFNYQVEATDAAGNVSGYSSVASATTPSPPGGAPTAPVFYNAVSNINTSGTISTLTTPSLPNGGNNPIFLYCIAWYKSSVPLSTVTNNLGVAGTAIATNVWANNGGGLGWDVTYYWGNSGMTNVTAVFGSAPGEISYYLVQCTNGPASSPYIGTVLTNNYLAASTSGIHITNIVSSTSNSLVVSFSVENALNVGAPTVGASPITSVGTVGSTGYHYATAAYKSGAASVTNDVTWSDSSSVPFDFTSVSIEPPSPPVTPPPYTLTVVNGTGSGTYNSGAIVSISASLNLPENGVFTNWSGLYIANTNSANTTVSMPASNLTVTPNYIPYPPGNVRISPGQ